MVEMKVVVSNKVGLHARPASVFVQTANKFTSEISVQNLTTGGNAVDAKSILMLLSLGVAQNHEILIRAEGVDAEKAVKSLRDLVQKNCGEAVE
jgi:phosphocarrier protein HPr